MAMRSVVSRSGLCRLMEGGNWRSSGSGLRYSGDGRVLNEEERAQETVYIKVFLIWNFRKCFLENNVAFYWCESNYFAFDASVENGEGEDGEAEEEGGAGESGEGEI